MNTTRSKELKRTYQTWSKMKDRCNNPNSQFYHRYGGRGIAVCPRWNNSFKRFLNDMGKKPEEVSIQRIDNKKGYEPLNCKWAIPFEQGLNRGEPKGYTFHKTQGKYQVNVKTNGKKAYFGSYDDPEEARQVYLRAKARIHNIDIRPEVVKRLHNIWEEVCNSMT